MNRTFGSSDRLFVHSNFYSSTTRSTKTHYSLQYLLAHDSYLHIILPLPIHTNSIEIARTTIEGRSLKEGLLLQPYLHTDRSTSRPNQGSMLTHLSSPLYYYYSASLSYCKNRRNVEFPPSFTKVENSHCYSTPKRKMASISTTNNSIPLRTGASMPLLGCEYLQHTN